MPRKPTIKPQRLPRPSVAQRRGSTKSPHNCNGDFVYEGGAGDGGAGRVMHADSHLELVCIQCLAVHPDTADLFEQQAFDWHDEDGVVHTHFFDGVVRTPWDDRIAYAVRPEPRITRDYEERLARIRAQAIEAGFASDVRFLTERTFDAVDRHNAQLMHHVRRPDPLPDRAARTIVRAMAGIVTVGTLCERIGLGGAGFQAVVRLVRSRHLALLRHERITRTTQLIKKEQVQ